MVSVCNAVLRVQDLHLTLNSWGCSEVITFVRGHQCVIGICNMQGILNMHAGGGWKRNDRLGDDAGIKGQRFVWLVQRRLDGEVSSETPATRDQAPGEDHPIRSLSLERRKRSENLKEISLTYLTMHRTIMSLQNDGVVEECAGRSSLGGEMICQISASPLQPCIAPCSLVPAPVVASSASHLTSFL